MDEEPIQTIVLLRGWKKKTNEHCNKLGIKTMKEGHLKMARLLYRPTPKVEAIVLELCDLFDRPLLNGVVITSLSFKKGALNIGGLMVKEVVRGGQHCGVEVHWWPNHAISTKSDPFCSAFSLRYNSLQKLYREVEKVIVAMQPK